MNVPETGQADATETTPRAADTAVPAQRVVPPRWRHAVGGGFLATVLASALFTTLATPWLYVPWALVLVVLAPSARRLDRRVALNLAAAAGLVPVVTWLPPLLGPRTAAIAALALGTGAAVAMGAARPAEVVPSARRRDALIILAGALAGVVAFPLRDPGTPQRALSMLSTGIDNAYHYAMFLEQRLTAAGSTLVAANTDATGFAFDDYPQWFHRLLTVLAQIGFGDPASAGAELVRFAQLQWLVFVGLVILVTAAFLQALPRHVPGPVLLVALAVLLSMLLGVPGALNLVQGHLGFLVAASAPLVMFLVAFPQRVPGLRLFVVLGGLVLVTASWLLLLPMAGAAILPPTVTVWRRQTTVVRWAALASATLASITAFAVFVLGPLTHGGHAAVLRDGTVPQVGLPAMTAILVGANILLEALARRRPDLPLGAHRLLAVAATAQVFVLGGYMLSATGQLTYYFWKLGLGSLLVTVVVTTHALVTARIAARNDLHEGSLRPPIMALFVFIACAGLGVGLQNFRGPSVLWAAILPTALEARATSGDAGDVDLVLSLAASADPSDAARTRLLATRPEDMNAAHASEWFHALSHSATRRAVSVDDGVYELALDRGDLQLGVALAQSTLEQEDGRVLVTDPQLYEAIADSVPANDLARVSLTK